MEQRILSLLKEEIQVETGEVVVVGVSGGADSVCLLSILQKGGYKAVAAHFNHQLRAEANRDAEFVQNLAEKLNCPFESGSADVQLFALERHKSIEEAARLMRYQFLVHTAEKYNSKFIAVAHNADDQVETVMMHLTRGSGLYGLSGMKTKTIIAEFHPEIPIIRPLLSAWRSEIEEYLQDNGLSFCIDETNWDAKYTRNKFRLNVIPYLAELYPKFKEKIWNTAFLLSSDLEIIDAEVNQVWKKFVDESKAGVIRIAREGFLSETMGIQRYLIRKAVSYLQPFTRDISFESIQRGIAGIQSKQSGLIALEDDLWIELSNDAFFIFKRSAAWEGYFFPQIDTKSPLPIEATGEYAFGPGWILKIESLDAGAIPFQPVISDSRIIALDGAAVKKMPFSITNKSAGDRFSPFGMETGSIKLSDFFINEKIPKSARNNWPILKDRNGEILWVIGLRSANAYKVTSYTRKILRLEIFNPSELHA
jgi:tRNA(Ile)-lysidine synthase